MFYERHWSNVSRHMATALAGEIAAIVQLLQVSSYEDERQQAFLDSIIDNMYLHVEYFQTKPVAKQKDRSVNRKLQLLHNVLEQQLKRPFYLTYINDGADIQIDVALFKGMLSFTASNKRIENPTTYIFILWMIGTATILLLISVLFLRNQVRSISKLAIAAEKFGRGQDIQDFKPTGAKEVRKAANAFIRMKERLKRQITRRTEMLAGVSHDLRTPLTRMKLQLEMMGEQDAANSLKADLMEMEKMIQGYLTFAKGEEGEIAQTCNIKEVLETLVQKFTSYPDASITCHKLEDCTLYIQYHAFCRAISNILENAMRYATHATLSMDVQEEYVHLTINDDGPGIPEAHYGEVFKPFFRLDASRNLETGGVGLGLSIARDIINAHGGDITLDTSPDGGLSVTIRIPR